jgi:hypothetical protein
VGVGVVVTAVVAVVLTAVVNAASEAVVETSRSECDVAVERALEVVEGTTLEASEPLRFATPWTLLSLAWERPNVTATGTTIALTPRMPKLTVSAVFQSMPAFSAGVAAPRSRSGGALRAAALVNNGR